MVADRLSPRGIVDILHRLSILNILGWEYPLDFGKVPEWFLHSPLKVAVGLKW